MEEHPRCSTTSVFFVGGDQPAGFLPEKRRDQLSLVKQHVLQPSVTRGGDEPVPAPSGIKPSTALRVVHSFPETCAKIALLR